MTNIRENHDRAMELAELAAAARRRGELEAASALFQESLAYERRACELVAPDLAAEPTRSILHRSAAALAVACGEPRAAERLIAVALSGNPPDEIADELRDLLKQVYKDFRKAPLPVGA